MKYILMDKYMMQEVKYNNTFHDRYFILDKKKYTIVVQV